MGRQRFDTMNTRFNFPSTDGLTQLEVRSHLIVEMKRWFESMIPEVMRLCEELAEPDVNQNRMYAVLHFLEKSNYLDQPVDQRIPLVTHICYSVCLNNLMKKALDSSTIIEMILPFLDEADASGKTIRGYWDASPFDPLRNAPPLTEVDEVDSVSAFEDDGAGEVTDEFTDEGADEVTDEFTGEVTDEVSYLEQKPSLDDLGPLMRENWIKGNWMKGDWMKEHWMKGDWMKETWMKETWMKVEETWMKVEETCMKQITVTAPLWGYALVIASYSGLLTYALTH